MRSIIGSQHTILSSICFIVSWQFSDARIYDGVANEVPLGTRQVNSSFSIGTSWQVLGPFQIGTREGSWGADPLEYLGGFKQLHYDSEARFRSSLPSNGTAKWSVVEATQSIVTDSSANVSLRVGYDDVDWDFLKVVYGWAAVQYQAWARGEITVLGTKTLPFILYTDAIVEYWIDDTHYFGGDAFTFRKAPPVLHLSPGTHKLDLRLWRDVRAFGGILTPTIDVVVELHTVSGGLDLAEPGILMSHVVDGKLASPLGSISLRNTGQEDVEILGITPSDVRAHVSLPCAGRQVVLIEKHQALITCQDGPSPHDLDVGVILVAGQTRSVAFNISLPVSNESSIHYTVRYRAIHANDQVSTLNLGQDVTHKSVFEPHKVTFRHPAGIVSYAMIRPPSKNATCRRGTDSTLPVLVGLHGAGVEADNDLVAHALDPVPDLCAWVVFPTGVTPWSSDDWHNWGFADVEAAVESVPSWMKQVNWTGPGIDIGRWIVFGHSNGGQGTWYALTHRPDKLVAAAPLSGYASIQEYVLYELWQPADPRRTAVVSASLNSFRHEMLLENAKGIPVLQQHGEIDDNVPAYNSRLLSQLLFQAGTNSSYHEFLGKNHYWDGVMTTEPLRKFYQEQTQSDVRLPRQLDEFSIVVAHPGDMGSKSGIRVLALEDPGQYGRVKVKGHEIKTSNVLSLEFDLSPVGYNAIDVDGSQFQLSGGAAVTLEGSSGMWKVGILSQSDNVLTRHGRQLGTIAAILRTSGPFTIRYQENRTAHIALQISRNFHQYFYADSDIVSSASWDDDRTGNVITVAIGDAPPSLHPSFPIDVGPSGISVRDSKGRLRMYQGDDQSVGAIFLRPLAGERLELVVWGSDMEGLSQAARLVPTTTGVGQPDFIILGTEAKWRGLEGSLALGFFGHKWEVTPSSVLY
ncbi:hypothetical protein K491DRAFT_589649 [Lophiostoma macrostomum CBS 122681]|uniref:Peptidase S9 prolyl oligopeptidase catalytic domain-containing protein n=1 Tax=Lophiostoma macrostomum CBS 122681 TaxID=1314788 RepID=A0A6A6TKH6_9PLEO|nr:hypothetical protein K491DRAFT_589649 [Lophiostoma macrostomum CBS 122681]